MSALLCHLVILFLPNEAALESTIVPCSLKYIHRHHSKEVLLDGLLRGSKDISQTGLDLAAEDMFNCEVFALGGDGFLAGGMAVDIGGLGAGKHG